MKQKKWTRFLALTLSVIMTLSIAGCRNNKEENEKQESQQSEQQSEQQSAESEGEKVTSSEPITTEPVTISILTQRHSTATNDASDLWFFKYMEYWFEQQGYDVTIEVTQTTETAQQKSLMLGTDSLVDVVWGIALGTDEAVLYGAEQGAILDWTPYINEETMPNVYAKLEENQIAKLAGICIDGGIYGLPFFTTSTYGSGTFGTTERMYINQKWLDECNLEVPTDVEGFIDMLRAFKENITLESGDEVIPLISNAGFLEKYVWLGLGYYGTSVQYGSGIAIKDEQVHLPAYTEDYRTFIEFMNTLYTEGLISPDHFTMDGTTARGLMQSGVCGVLADWTLTYCSEPFSDWVCAEPICFGDNDEIYVSTSSNYTSNTIWASADTKYPEIVAMLVDFVYSEEGSMIYCYGPKEGEDPLNMLDGWYYDEKGAITTKMVEEGIYDEMITYCRQYVYPYDYVGVRPVITNYGYGQTWTFKDAVTGEDVNTIVTEDITHEDNNGHWRLITQEMWNPHITTVGLPTVYLDEETALRATELKTVIEKHIKAESAKFITGTRPLDEVDDYYKELEQLGVQEYIEIYQAAYSNYIEAIFN